MELKDDEDPERSLWVPGRRKFLFMFGGMAGGFLAGKAPSIIKAMEPAPVLVTPTEYNRSTNEWNYTQTLRTPFGFTRQDATISLYGEAPGTPEKPLIIPSITEADIVAAIEAGFQHKRSFRWARDFYGNLHPFTLEDWISPKVLGYAQVMAGRTAADAAGVKPPMSLQHADQTVKAMAELERISQTMAGGSKISAYREDEDGQVYRVTKEFEPSVIESDPDNGPHDYLCECQDCAEMIECPDCEGAGCENCCNGSIVKE